MPYIGEERRKFFENHLEALAHYADGKGELNYCFCRLAVLYMVQLRDEANWPLNYDFRSEVHAALQDAANEFRRRVLDKYEDKAKERNGDVFAEVEP